MRCKIRPPVRGISALVLIAALALSAAPAFPGMQAVRASVRVETARPPLAEVSFRLVDDHILLPVSINNSPPIDMLLDTGMAMKGVMVLDPATADRLDLDYTGTVELGGGGGEQSRKARVAGNATLSVSGFSFPGQDVFVPEETAFADDWPAAAILGTTFFDHVVQIDFSNSLIGLYESAEDLPRDPGHALDLDFTMGIPVVEAQMAVNDEGLLPITLMVDTGVNAPLLIFPYSLDMFEVPDGAVQTRSGVLSEGLTGEVEGSIGRVERLNLASYEFTDVVTAFPTQESMGHANILGQNGFVGTSLLKHFTVVFDYPNDQIFLKPNDAFGSAFEWNMAGLLMGVNRDGFLLVKDVVEGSPAAKQGLKANDVITAVEGRSVRKLDNDTIHSLFNKEGALLHLEVQRGSDRNEVTLTLRRII